MIFQILGLLAGTLQLIGYAWYIRYVVSEYKKPGTGISPNTGSWIIWSYGNLIVCWNYLSLSKELKTNLSFTDTLPIVCSGACIVATLIFLLLNKLKKPEPREIVILIIDVLITCYWLYSGDNKISQILLQISVIISFIPIIMETKNDPLSEKCGPWYIWSLAYSLLFFSKIPEGVWEWIYPINYLIWHLAMALIVQKTKPLLAK